MLKVARLVLAGGLTLLVGSVPTYAQSPSVAPDLSGDWLVQDPGSGSWYEWYDNVPAPALRPEIIKMNEADLARLEAGNVTNTTPRRPDCPGGGNLPMSMASSGDKTLVVMRDQVEFAGRVIYTDGRPHPDAKSPAYKPSGSGHSIGRWEGDTLAVDTIGFPAFTCDSRWPVMRVPGGGRAKETTRLVERYRLSTPDTLQVTFSWEDPSVYLKPHTYGYTFKRITLPKDDPAHAPPARKFLTDEYWSR